ncbi:zf-TFIIB domain-containing protein [Aliarcobacter butzleri]|jgi:hypothetical protein|uniref:TFIIB-type zinc ribbon-containing protein n=1 Tax=Aliarcobacter butzleri TaxID=28197 RepID=UPI003AF63E55
MKCPVCVTESLVMSERSGIEIDYCPRCRGVWLDRGELDKIIERANNQASQSSVNNLYSQNRSSSYNNHNSHDNHSNQKHHKKESFWSELFD